MEFAVLDFLKPLLATFVGAMLAFFSAWLMRQSQKEQDQIAAANMALANAGQMANSFLIYKNQVLAEQRKMLKDNPNLPTWMQLRVVFYRFDESLKINLDRLPFLFNHRTVDAVNDAIAAQMVYQNLMMLHETHREYVTELQKMAAAIPEAQTELGISVTLLMKKIPLNQQGLVASINEGLLDVLAKDEVIMTKAVTSLRQAFVSTLGSDGLIRIKIPEQLLSVGSKKEKDSSSAQAHADHKH